MQETNTFYFAVWPRKVQLCLVSWVSMLMSESHIKALRTRLPINSPNLKSIGDPPVFQSKLFHSQITQSGENQSPQTEHIFHKGLIYFLDNCSQIQKTSEPKSLQTNGEKQPAGWCSPGTNLTSFSERSQGEHSQHWSSHDWAQLYHNTEDIQVVVWRKSLMPPSVVVSTTWKAALLLVLPPIPPRPLLLCGLKLDLEYMRSEKQGH